MKLAAVIVASFLIAAFAIAMAFRADMRTCEELQQRFGPGRCTFGRDGVKIILSDGTARYIP